MKVSEQVKKYIRDNIDLIGKGQFKELYLKKLGITKSSHGMIGFGGPQACFRYVSELTSVLTDAGIDVINQFEDVIPIAFYYKNKNIDYIQIPDGIQHIMPYAFAYSTLNSIKLPTSVKRIGQGAFIGTILTGSLDLSSVTTIDRSAFENCALLEEVSLSKDIKLLPFSIFQNCKSLKKIFYPGTISQWRSMRKEGWHKDTHDIQVVCSDGVINIL